MLAGVLVDVSGSMEQSLQLDIKPTNQSLTRAESIFNTIIKIAETEVTQNEEQKIFVIAFGLQNVKTADLLTLLEHFSMPNNNSSHNYANGYESLIQLLERNGAPHAKNYIKKYLKESEARFLNDYYSRHNDELAVLVKNLPSACKDYMPSLIVSRVSDMDFLGITEYIEKNKAREHADKAILQAEGAIRKASRLQAEHAFREASRPKTRTLKAAVDLLHRVSGKPSCSSLSADKSLSAEQLKNLIDFIKPHIYGDTPMCKALEIALDMFKGSSHDHKVLFLLTDGQATDGDPVRFITKIDNEKIRVFVCLISSDNILNPRQLYYEPDPNWEKEQVDMFKLSTLVDNTHPMMSVLLEHGWKLPTSGQSRLFVQANHPDVIDEFSSLVRRAAESNDALLNILARASLDKYINSANSTFKPTEQIGGTCYAHALATVLHLAMHRIVGREGGYPEFAEIRDQLIREYGHKGAYTENVLNLWTPRCRLQYKEVDELGARNAINARRPVAATFSLYEQQWTAFGEFYRDNPQGILEAKNLGMHSSLTKREGHAVVLIECYPKSLKFLNSWGTKFADGGFFKVRNQSALNLKFYDVYWTLNDLKESEIKAFDRKKKELGEGVVRALPPSIQNLLYECPKCHQSSSANKFTGHLLEAKCPKCKKNFRPAPIGLILNQYTL